MSSNIAHIIIALIIVIVLIVIIIHIKRKNRLYEKYDLIDKHDNATENKQKQIENETQSETNKIKPKFEPAGNIADPLYEQRNKTNKFQNTSTYLINTLDMANAQISNNTFTNHLIDLFDNNQDVKPDGESDDEIPENVINKTDGKFYDKLFYNDQQLSDIFLSQRTFVTQPITRIANQQQEFAEWLYGGSKYHEGPNICKTDQSKCLQYEDLRLSQRNY
jgi:hypothetical protein